MSVMCAHVRACPIDNYVAEGSLVEFVMARAAHESSRVQHWGTLAQVSQWWIGQTLARDSHWRTLAQEQLLKARRLR